MFSLRLGNVLYYALFCQASFSFHSVGEDYPLWMIPISICTSEDPTHAKKQVLMDKPELSLVLKDVKPEQWVKVSNCKGEMFL